MIITYTSGARTGVVLGNGWEASRWHKHSDSLIIDQLWNTIHNNKHLDFRKVQKAVNYHYKNKTVRSRAFFELNGDTFDIVVKGVFPKIRIFKDQANE